MWRTRARGDRDDRAEAQLGSDADHPGPALDAGPFSLTIDHLYLPMVVGAVTVLESPDGSEKVQVSVLDQTEDVGRVTTRVVEEREWEDGELIYARGIGMIVDVPVQLVRAP